MDLDAARRDGPELHGSLALPLLEPVRDVGRNDPGGAMGGLGVGRLLREALDLPGLPPQDAALEGQLVEVVPRHLAVEHRLLHEEGPGVGQRPQPLGLLPCAF